MSGAAQPGPLSQSLSSSCRHMRILRGCLRLIIPSTSVAIDVDSAVTRITGRRFTRSFPPASTTNSVVQPEFVHSTSSASNTLVIGSPRSISRSSAWMARPPSTEATMDPLQVGKFECHGVSRQRAHMYMVMERQSYEVDHTVHSGSSYACTRACNDRKTWACFSESARTLYHKC